MSGLPFDPFGEEPLRPPNFEGVVRRTAAESFGGTVVKIAARAAADPAAVLDACYAACRDRTGVRALDPIDLNAPTVAFPLKVAAVARVEVDSLSRVLTDFERTHLYRAWCRTADAVPAFDEAPHRAMAFHWAAKWGETFVLTDSDLVDGLPPIRPYGRPDFALYVFSEMVKHIGWRAVP